MKPPPQQIQEPTPTFATRVKDSVSHWLHLPTTEIVLLVMIVASVVLMVVEMMMPIGDAVRHALELISDGFTVVFAVELILRFAVARKKSRFFKRYWLDILAVMPLARPLRFFRVLRLLRIFRAGVLINRRLSLFRGVFRGTASEMTALAAMSMTLVLAAAMTVHLSESGLGGDFRSFEDSLWFAVFSLIAGEPVGGNPETELGRWTTLGLMVGGLTVFGMFVGTVSASMVSRLSSRLELHEMDVDELEGHVLVCGWNRSGPTVVRELFGSAMPPNRPVVVLTEHPRPDDLPVDGVRPELLYHMVGDYTRADVLMEAAVERASCAILLTDGIIPRSDQDRDARTVLAALTIERLVPTIYTVAELTNRDNESLLAFAGVEEVVVGNWYAGVILGSASRNPGLVSALDEVLTTEHGNAFHTLRVPARWSGKTVGELHGVLLSDHRAILISVEQRGDDGSRTKMLVNPPPDVTVTTGDALMVLATREVVP